MGVFAITLNVNQRTTATHVGYPPLLRFYWNYMILQSTVDGLSYILVQGDRTCPGPVGERVG